MKIVVLGILLVGIAAIYRAEATQATNKDERAFQRVGTFANYRQHPADAADGSVSEIVVATRDGGTLVYTDAARGRIGLVDITNPANPQPLGAIEIDPDPGDDREYSPTSLDVLGNDLALAAVSTGASFTSPDGALVVVDLATRTVLTEIPLGGQPDSIKISPDGRYAAITIENERDEDLCVGGTAPRDAGEEECVAGGGVLGGLPQTQFGNPPGHLAVLKLAGPPNSWTAQVVPLAGLASYAPEDPEPEFVDVNRNNEAVVSLQETNHLVIVDLATATVKSHFSAGTVSLEGIDLQDDNVLSLTETLANVAREPDAVAWVPGLAGGDLIATANEGDLFGGSRGFSVFKRNGQIFFDAGTSLERIAVEHGHYPEGRSDAKGTEPEALTYGRFGANDYLFVGSERGGFIAVYSLNAAGRPKFEQLLPAPLEPEGLLAIPERNLLVASGEADLEGLNVRSTIMIYELKPGAPTYPQIRSINAGGSPIPWSALSGMVAAPDRRDTLLAVWDSAYADSNVFRIDVSGRTAVIDDVLTLKPTDGTGNYDPEGIAVAPDGSLWIASEGNATDSRPNLLLKVDREGTVVQEVGLPTEILQCRAASTSRGTLGSGFEGLAVLPNGTSYHLVVAQQRGWDYTSAACEHLDDDDGGLNSRGEPNRTRLWIFDPATDTWDHVAWQLAPLSPYATWVGLSEITEAPDGRYVVIERDNRSGDFAVLKTLVQFPWSAAADRLITPADKSFYDLLPDLRATRGWITDKPEGVAISSSGDLFVVTDNDGVDDWSGETWFFNLGAYWRLFE